VRNTIYKLFHLTKFQPSWGRAEKAAILSTFMDYLSGTERFRRNDKKFMNGIGLILAGTYCF